jgi:hypothetical protein
MKRSIAVAALAAAAVVVPAGVASAKVLKFEIVRAESPAFEGRSFGSVGTYDRIIARATIAVAPTDPHNSIVVDVDRAPRNAQGQVEAVTDVEILRPTNAANGNRRLFYEALNRGGKLGFALFNDDNPVVNDLVKSGDAGNGFLMNRGYTLVWSGWQGDIVPGGGRMTFSPPVATGITGAAREEFVFDNMDNPASGPLSYPAADLDPAQARLTVREREADERSTPADLSFKYDGDRKVSISRPANFDAGAIYELIYPAKDPKVMGLGLAATRDVVSFLRYEKVDAAGNANVLDGRIFEGLMPHISGGKKTFTNYRFSQPGRSPYQHADMVYPGSEFPFTYPVTTDVLTGKSDGLLARCLIAKNCPKIIKSDSEIEFYQQRASLVVTDTQGNALAMPDNVRLFFLSNLQHFALANSKPETTKTCQFPTNPLNAGPSVRALLVALEAWITNGTEPPASRYPSVADGTLVAPTIDAVGFPKIPGFPYKGTMTKSVLIDFSVMPPVKGKPYPAFLPKTDADGRAIAGVHLPTLEAPAATHTGWNVRKAGYSEGELCENNGSVIPFAATTEERLKTGDPRLSMAERYPHEGDRAAAIEKAAKQLVQDRLLLEEDVKIFTQTTN